MKVHEVDDVEKINRLKKNTFEAWSTIILTRVSSKRIYWELKGGFSFHYVIKNYQLTKTLYKAVDIRRKAKFKENNNNDKINTQK